MKKTIIVTLIALFAIGTLSAQETKKKMDAPIYGFTMKTIEGKDKSLADYKGKVLMIVNTASFCGNTPQYKQLEALNKKYKDQGLAIIGFPANNFGKQEPGNDGDIKTFCEKNYGVTFDMFSKISVKGDDIHPLYKYLTTETGFNDEIDWNFAKYLVDKHGKIVARFKASMKPDEKEIVAKIDELLTQK